MLDTRPYSDTMMIDRHRAISWALGREIQTLLRHRASPYWLLGAASLAGTLINGPLVLSAGIGLAVHQQLTELTPQQWQQLADRLQRQSVSSPKAKVWLLSAAAVMTTYGAAAVWSSSDAIWLLVILGGQSLLAVALGGLRSEPSTPPAEIASPPLDAALANLVHENPLKRLIGVRQVIRHALQEANQEYLPGQTVRSHLLDCLHLMLAQEEEPMVRTAIREGLEQLREKPQLRPGAPAVRPPLRRQPQPATPATRLRRTVVEYVEP